MYLIGLEGQQVTEDQMRALFGQGEHPNSDAMVRAYLKEHIRAGMTDRQRENLTAAAIRHATLGRRFPAYEPLQEFDARVGQRLVIIRSETGRDPTKASARAHGRPRSAGMLRTDRTVGDGSSTTLRA